MKPALLKFFVPAGSGVVPITMVVAPSLKTTFTVSADSLRIKVTASPVTVTPEAYGAAAATAGESSAAAAVANGKMRFFMTHFKAE